VTDTSLARDRADASDPRHQVRIITVAALAYGALIYLMLPPTTIVVNDDFGYLRSILETIARGRPWTDDWLEPWSASLSLISASVFLLTGSMHMATAGMQVLFAAASVAGATALFRDRGIGHQRAVVLALLLVSCPTILWKALEFTGVALYFPCLLWAIWAAGRRRWWLFAAVWLVAVMTRQSAVTWLALPAWAAIVGIFHDRDRVQLWMRPALTVAAGLVVVVLLSAWMNKTHSQAMITDHLREDFVPRKALEKLLLGVATALGCLGLGAAVGGSARHHNRLPVSAIRAVVVLLAATILVWSVLQAALYFEHDSYEPPFGVWYGGLALAVTLTGWLGFRMRLRPDLLLAAAGSLALVGVRGQVWDYYFLDVAIFALFAVGAPGGSVAWFRTPRLITALVTVTLVALAALHLQFALELKRMFDRSYAISVLLERTLRRGQIGPDDLSTAPFGLIGWHLHPYFVVNEGADDRGIANFLRYLRPAALHVEIGPPYRGTEPAFSSSQARADDPNVVRSGVFPSEWFWQQRYTLFRRPADQVPPAPMAIDRGRYVTLPFPLTDDEWREALETVKAKTDRPRAPD
jgi:hypothetical protein